VTATLPQAVQEAFRGFLTAELTTIDARGRPITWPVTPFYQPGDASISVTTGLGFPKKARDARRNPKVALLFSDPTGSGIRRPSMVLLQGVAEVDDGDLDANRERYVRHLADKLGSRELPPGGQGQRFDWYFGRIYLHVRPERVLVWPGGDCGLDPERVDPGMDEPLTDSVDPAPEPAPQPAGGAGRGPRVSARIHELGRRYDSAVLSFVEQDGFPFSIRVPVSVDRRGRTIHVDVDPVGAPLRPGRACVTAHDHDEELRWTRNFQVRGALSRHPDGGWVVVPHRVVDGFELPPTGALIRAVSNIPKIRRFRKTAKRERARREPGLRGR
jgi:hypothetical protein